MPPTGEPSISSDLIKRALGQQWPSVDAWAKDSLQILHEVKPHGDHLVSFDSGQKDDWKCISTIGRRVPSSSGDDSSRRVPPLPSLTLLAALGPRLNELTDPAIYLGGQDLKIWKAFLSAGGRDRGLVLCPTKRTKMQVLVGVLLDHEDPKDATALDNYALLARLCGMTHDKCLLKEEVEHLRRTLSQQDSFSTLGHLLAGFAHDLGSPLQAILNSAEVIERGQQRHDPVTEARQISRAALRARGMIQDLIAFTRTDSFPLSAVPPVESVLDALELRRSVPRGQVDVQVLADPLVSPVLAHPERLTQVLVNLLDNAQYAVMTEGRGGVRVSFVQSHSESANEVAIIIENDGPVLPHETASRLFEHGFTTKPRGQGHGIGLSIARRLTELMGGTLNYDPSFASGTRMVLKLKIAGSDQPQSQVSSAKMRKQGERVLIVDDDEELVQSYAAILSLEGFQVLSATRGKAALEILRSDTVDAILCDYHLPDVSAKAFQKQLEEQFPQMMKKVIYATGDEADPQVQKFLQERTTPTLIKPFRLDQLLRALRQTIEGSTNKDSPSP